MANAQIGALIGGGRIVNPSLSINNSGDSQLTAAQFGYTKDIYALRVRLKAQNAGLYTDKYLDTMTANDMVFAVLNP